MSSTRCSLATLLLLLVIPCVAVAGGQPQPTGDKQPAALGKMHFERGLQLYRAGKFADAIGEFESGYAVLPRPAFLLNIAQAWRKLGDVGWARLYYQRFVDQADPDDPARAQAQASLARLNGPEPVPRPAPRPLEPTPPAVEPTPPPEPAPPPAVVTPTPAPPKVDDRPPPRRSRTAGWAGVALAAAGVGAIGAGAGLVVDAQALDRRYLHPADGAHYDPDVPRQRDLERDVAIGLFVGGGALVALGGVLAAVYLPSPPPSRHALALRPLLAPTALGMSLAGAF
jgi:hypothetical protein